MSTLPTDPGVVGPVPDQQVYYMLSSTSPPLQACVVQIWPDGLVDLVVTDHCVTGNFKVRRVPFVTAGGTNTPVYPDDPRYAQALPDTTGTGTVVTPIVTRAANPTWDGSGIASTTNTATDGSGNWDTSTACWNNNITDQAWNNAADDTAIIGNNHGAAGTLTLTTPITAGGLIFNAPGSGAYTLTGSTLSLTGSSTITVNADATIVTTLTGPAGLIKTGAGTLDLAGSNSYPGGTIISAGTLKITALTGAGTGTITLGDANTGANNVTLTGNSGTGTVPMQNNIIVASQGSGTATLELTAQNAQWGGASIQLNRPTIFQANYSGSGGAYFGKYNNGSVISGNVGTLTVQALSTGKAYVDGNNTFVGTVALPQGTVYTFDNNAFGGSVNSVVMSGTAALGLFNSNLTIGDLTGGPGNTVNTSGGGNGLLTISSANNATYAGTISGGGALTKSGTGTQALTGSNTYTGATTLNGGTLSVSSLPNGGVASGIGQSSNAAGNLVFNGGMLQYTGAGASTDRQFTLGTSGGSLDASGTGPLDFVNTGAIAFSGSGPRSLILTGSSVAANTLAAQLVDSGGPSALLKTEPGTWLLTGANTYTGGTTVHAGTLATGAGGSLAATGAVNLAASGAGFDISTGGNQTIGALAGVSGSNITLGANTLTFGGSTNQTFAGSAAGTGGLTKQGSGTQTLTGTNTYTGSTTINAGTVQLARGGGSAYAGMLAFSGTGACALDTGGTDVTFGGLSFGQNIKGTNATVTGGGSLTISGSTQVALASSVNGDGYTQTFNIAGGTNVTIPNLLLGSDSSSSQSYNHANLNVQDGATLTVGTLYSAYNHYTGGANSPGSFAVFTIANATLEAPTFYFGCGTRNSGYDASGTTLNINAGGLVLAGTITNSQQSTPANQGGAVIALNGGTLGNLNASTNLSIVNPSAQNPITIQLLSGGGTIDITPGASANIAPVISGAGALVIGGGGKVTLTGANTYAGGTTVNSSTLTAGAVSAFGTGAITVNAGATLAKNGFAIANLIVNNGGTVTP